MNGIGKGTCPFGHAPLCVR